MRKCILAVQGPLHFVTGFIAMKWYEQLKHNGDEAEYVLLLFDFLSQPELEGPLVDSIMQLATMVKWNKVVFISGKEMRGISCQRYSKSIIDLKKIIGCEDVDEIFICRDTYGFGSPLILNAYPRAVRIMYGDSFGIAGEEVKYQWTWGKESIYIIKHFLRELIWGKPARFKFNAAVLSLPLDWTGTYLDNITLLVPSRDHVLNIIDKFSQHLSNLNSYCDSLLQGTKDKYLFLLSSLSASGFMSRENESALNESIIRQVAPKGETILIKNHLRSPTQVLIDLVNLLKDDYNIRTIDDAGLSFMPIELWASLIKNCRVVPVLSFSTLSLRYIYDKEVIFPLNKDNINKYFYPDIVPNIIKQCKALSESVKALKDWDGRSVLWRNQERSEP